MATTSPASTSATNPNAGMTMSPTARARMRATEKLMLKYYNDMGKTKGNCSWGIGFYAHKGVCSEAELKQKVSASSVDIEYAKRVAEAERRIKRKVHVQLTQAQFDGLVSFTYNTRSDANQRVYDALNNGSLANAAKIISDSIHVSVDGKKKLAPGLIRRRSEESAPFRSPKTDTDATKPKNREVR